jgi:phytoene/squalene synthetase
MSVAACAALVERGDPDRFLAAMAAPVAARERLFPLYAFNLEVARAPWVTEETLIAEMRLQWWRDAVAEVAEGSAPRAHEVMVPLGGVIRGGVPGEVLDGIIAARRWDIYREGFASVDELWAQLDATGGGLMWASCLALGGADEAAARSVGRAGALAGWLTAVPELEARGRLPLPEGADLARLARDGLAMLRVRAGGPGVPALRAAWRAGAILGQVAASPARVRDGSLGTSEFARRGSLMWRALRGVW